jgi:hypothetical protein
MRCIITLANNEQLKDLIELAKDLGVEVTVEDESEKTAEPEAAQAAPGAASEPEETAPVEIAAAETAETATDTHAA